MGVRVVRVRVVRVRVMAVRASLDRQRPSHGVVATAPVLDRAGGACRKGQGAARAADATSAVHDEWMEA